MAIVVDASVAASWLFADQDDVYADAVLEQLSELEAFVPELWHFEMRNILLVARRRQRISLQGLHERLEALSELPLQTDAEPHLDTALSLADTHGLSFYDALYLENARRRQAILGTLDKKLLAAARAEHVAVLQDQ